MFRPYRQREINSYQYFFNYLKEVILFDYTEDFAYYQAFENLSRSGNAVFCILFY